MDWIDGHLDLAYLAVCGRDVRAPCPDPHVGCISLPALREAGVGTIFGTIFTEPDARGPDAPFTYRDRDDLDGAEAAGRRQLDVYESLAADGQITLVRNAADLDGNGPRPRVVLLMEGADPIRDPAHARWWHERGLRMVGLTWSAGTRYAGGNARPGPLTARGRDLVSALDDLGIVHDASHLADAALDGLLEHARGRVVATHSNCRALLDNENQRHLRDEQIRAIADRDGVVGLNLYGAFLARGRRATIADCVRHVEHVATIFGHRRSVALGSDMDGGFGPEDLPAELDRPATLGALADALRAAGWSEGEVAGFAGGNWRRLLDEVLPRDTSASSSTG
ncbi:MAG: dipeptidase [Planctomycetota bacterium]|jgi:membrane dipeptidase